MKDKQTGKRAHGWSGRQADRQTKLWTSQPTGRQNNRHADRQIDMQ